MTIDMTRRAFLRKSSLVIGVAVLSNHLKLFHASPAVAASDTPFQPHAFLEIAADDADSYVISIPPPNVTGALHNGHAMFVSLEDLMIRHARMNGRATLWVPGTDHAGIATQLQVEKMLRDEGTSRQEAGRD